MNGVGLVVGASNKRGANFQAKKKSSRDSTETLKTGTANEQRWAEGGTRI